MAVGNRRGKLSRTAEECRAGIDLQESGTGPLYWVSIFPTEDIKLGNETDPKSGTAILDSLKPHLNAEESVDIQRGALSSMLVAFGLESTGKTYYAVKGQAMQLVPPEGSSSEMGALVIRLTVIGDNFDALVSDPLFLFVYDWDKSSLAYLGKPTKLKVKSIRDLPKGDGENGIEATI